LLKKKDLIDAARHYSLKVTESLSKVKLKKLVLCYLVEELITKADFTNKLRGQQLLELKHLEFQERESMRGRINSSLRNWN